MMRFNRQRALKGANAPRRPFAALAEASRSEWAVSGNRNALDRMRNDEG